MCGSWRGLRTAPEETLSAVTQAVCAAGIQGPGHGGRREAFQPGGCSEESGSVTVWGARGGAARDTRLPYGGRPVGRGKGTDAPRARSSGEAGPAQGDVRGLDSRGSTGVRWGRQMTRASS